MLLPFDGGELFLETAVLCLLKARVCSGDASGEVGVCGVVVRGWLDGQSAKSES